MKESITIVNGPMVEAVSSVVVNAVMATAQSAERAGAEQEHDREAGEGLGGQVDVPKRRLP